MPASPRERIEAALKRVTMVGLYRPVALGVVPAVEEIRKAVRELEMNQAFYADMKRMEQQLENANRLRAGLESELDRLAEVVELQRGQSADLREYLQQIIEEGDEHAAGIARAALAPDPHRPIPSEINALVDEVLAKPTWTSERPTEPGEYAVIERHADGQGSTRYLMRYREGDEMLTTEDLCLPSMIWCRLPEPPE